MPIVTTDQTTVSQKKLLTEEELQTLKNIQIETQSLIAELGEIEMVKLQTEKRHQLAKSFLEELIEKAKKTNKIYI